MSEMIIVKVKLALNIVTQCLRNYFSKSRVFYIVENANWSINHDGLSITHNLDVESSVVITYYGIRNSIVHYGSINTFIHEFKGLRLPHKSNRIFVTWFHVAPNDVRVNYIKEAIKHVELWHTSCSITKRKLVDLGIPSNKIAQIPLGVNLHAFSPVSLSKRLKLRKRLSVPDGKVIIGSYQKDGNGWGEGMRPKLIKGPDVFCDVVENLAKEKDIFVLLTGPARGYVKKRLKAADIPYHHDFLKSSDDVAAYYRATDLYIVASREEGGPKQILESMASGVPVVSTHVGMAEDIIINGENGFVVGVEDVTSLTQKAIEILEDEQLRMNMVDEGLKTAQKYDWSDIAQQYKDIIYKL